MVCSALLCRLRYHTNASLLPLLLPLSFSITQKSSSHTPHTPSKTLTPSIPFALLSPYVHLGGGGAWGTSNNVNTTSTQLNRGAANSLLSSGTGSGSVSKGHSGVGASCPAPSNTVERTVRGSSSVGGWGFDKGTAWHAVSLPPSLPSSAGSGKGIRGVGAKAGDRYDVM